MLSCSSYVGAAILVSLQAAIWHSERAEIAYTGKQMVDNLHLVLPSMLTSGIVLPETV